jgi:hypothetical protein
VRSCRSACWSMARLFHKIFVNNPQ